MLKPIALASTLAGLLSGCASTTSQLPSDSPLDSQIRHSQAALSSNPQLPSASPITVSSDPYIPFSLKQKNSPLPSRSTWLSSISLSIKTGSAPLPLTEILRLLAQQGINVVSEMPLDKYTYAGFSLSNVSADTALKAILASANLDYSVDSASKLVTIKPLSSKTWYLNTGNRTTEYSSGNPSTSDSKLKASGTSTISAKDNFWESLKSELEQRTQVTVSIPQSKNTPAPSPTLVVPSSLLPPPIPTPATIPSSDSNTQKQALPSASATPPSSKSADSAFKTEKVAIASYAINPETGAISVQGPSWLLEEIDAYIKQIQSQYNTNLTFEGELLVLNTDSANSEGFNIASFASFASSRYGVVLNSNSSGSGYSFSIPKWNLTAGEAATGTPMDLSKIPGVSSSGLAAPALGLVSALDGLQLFNNYLSTQGKVTSLQKPVITTTSGSPVDFRKTTTRYYNTVSQNSSSSTSSSSVATQNNLVAQEFGTILRVNPRFDPSTGLVRAQIELTQTTQVGSQTIAQSISSGNSVSQVPTSVPIASKVIYSGEALLYDGDFLVMGGQSEEQASSQRNGIPGLMDTPVASPLTSNLQKDASKNTFYFVIKLKINKR